MRTSLIAITAALMILSSCSEFKKEKPVASENRRLSYTSEIAVILENNCVSCHRISTSENDTTNTGYRSGNYDLSNYYGIFGTGTDSIANAIKGDDGSLLLTVLQIAAQNYHQLVDASDLAALQTWVVEDSCYYGLSPNVHPAGWINPESANFHGEQIKLANWDYSSCAGCHGAGWAGGKVESSCFSCHAKPNGPENCNTCHGNFTGSPVDTVNWAPPRDLNGNTATTADGVGAHQLHLNPGSSGIHEPIPCRTCHIVPEKVTAVTHIKGMAGSIDTTDHVELNFSGLALTTSDSGNIIPAPVFDDENVTCSNTYCHGQFKNGKLNNTVEWTDISGGEPDCAACHSTPPSGSHPQGTWVQENCYACHFTVVDVNRQITDKALHVNGTVNLKSLHAEGWDDPLSDQFHGKSLADDSWDMSGCKSCHGSDYLGGESGKSCMDSGCHSEPNGPENCNTCHGNFAAAPDDTLSWAPPADLSGNTSTVFAGVGAHESHLTDSEILPARTCEDCHILPAAFDAAEHIDGSLPAEITFGLLANTETDSIPNPLWMHEQSTCSNVYCHGQFKNGNKDRSLSWTDVGSGLAACGTCHTLPPGGTHSVFVGTCSNCHLSTMNPDTTFKDNTKHMNGVINVFGTTQPWK